MLHKENPIINIINPPNLKITRRVFNYLKIVLISENKKTDILTGIILFISMHG